MILAPLQKMPNYVGDLGKLIFAKGFKKLPKVQKNANSGHTEYNYLLPMSLALANTKEAIATSTTALVTEV